MDIKLFKLKQYSIGVIFFTFLLLIIISLIIMSKNKIFLSAYDQKYDTLKDAYVVKKVSGLWSSYISYVILVISSCLFFVFFIFWLFFNIFSLYILKKIEIDIVLNLKKYIFLNFLTLFIGSIFILATCNAILNNRKNNEYISN